MERERRYPSDLTDEQWALIEVMLPLPKWMGRPERHSRRSIVDAILYVVRTGCSWRVRVRRGTECDHLTWPRLSA